MPQYHRYAVSRGEVPYLHLRRDCSREPLLFLHGFGVEPINYWPFLDQLCIRYDIIAPSMLGINIYEPAPKCISDYVELVHEFLEGIDFEPNVIVGHSLGAATTFALSQSLDVEAIVGINPLMPVNYGFNKFFRKTMSIGWRALKHEGLDSFVPKVIVPYTLNVAKGRKKIQPLVKSISKYRFDNEQGEPLHIETPTLIIQSTSDELFRLTGEAEELIDERFTDYSIQRVNHYHDYPLMEPRSAATRVKKFLKENTATYDAA